MSDPSKPGVSRTEFGGLEERHSTFEEFVNRRFDKQDRKLLELEAMGRHNGKAIEGQSKDLQANTRATNRTEAKVDKLAERSEDVLELVDLAKKNARLLEWFVKRAVPVLVAIGTGILWLIKY